MTREGFEALAVPLAIAGIVAAILCAKPVRSEELAVTKCGHLVSVYRMPVEVIQDVNHEDYTAWAVAFPKARIVWIRNDRSLRQIPVAHELDHVDGLAHDTRGRITKMPACGWN